MPQDCRAKAPQNGGSGVRNLCLTALDTGGLRAGGQQGAGQANPPGRVPAVSVPMVMWAVSLSMWPSSYQDTSQMGLTLP